MNRKTNSNFIVKLAVFGVLVIMLFAVINNQMTLTGLRETKDELQKQIDEVRDVIDEVQIRLDTPVTDEYIERVARKQLGYRMEGEIIFYNDLAN